MSKAINEKDVKKALVLAVEINSRKQRILEGALYSYCARANEQLKAHCDNFAPDDDGNYGEMNNDETAILHELSAQNSAAKMLWMDYLTAKNKA